MPWFRVKTVVDVEADSAAEAIEVAAEDHEPEVKVSPLVDDEDESDEDVGEDE